MVSSLVPASFVRVVSVKQKKCTSSLLGSRLVSDGTMRIAHKSVELTIHPARALTPSDVEL
eukprot:1755339-Rhodomonas_salina.3